MTEPVQQASDLLDRLLRHDAWTTQRLLDVTANLTDDQLDFSFEIGHQTIRKTFCHMIWNMECWTDLMKGGPIRPRQEDHPSIAELSQRLSNVSAELYRFAREITDQDRLNEMYLDRLDSPPRQKSFGTTILHVATHSMHHRAQLLFMLRRLGVKRLPEGDAISWELATHCPASSGPRLTF